MCTLFTYRGTCTKVGTIIVFDNLTNVKLPLTVVSGRNGTAVCFEGEGTNLNGTACFVKLISALLKVSKIVVLISIVDP